MRFFAWLKPRASTDSVHLPSGAPRRSDRSAPEQIRYTRAVIPFLHIGPVEIPTYGLMLAVGMVCAYYILRAEMARRGLAAKDSGAAEMFIALPCLAGIIGAKVYSVLETPHDLFADPWGQLFSRYGLTFTGGLIGGLGTFVWLARRRKIPVLDMLDASAPAVALGYGIGRIGCLLSGDGDYGVPTSLPWGMSFPHGLVPTTQTCVERGWPADCAVHPTPIYEFVVAAAIAWLLWRLGTVQIAVHRAKPKNAPPTVSHDRGRWMVTATLGSGAIFAAYLATTGVARFLVEFIRINPRVLWGLTNAQLASIASVAAGVLLWRHATRRGGSVGL